MNEMKPEDVMKAWEQLESYAKKYGCFSASYTDIHAILTLLREKDAEIERLKSHSGKCIYLSDDETTEYCVEGICPKYKTEGEIRAEAIKEFAEELKKHLCEYDLPHYHSFCAVEEETIDQIAKEMGVEL